MEKVYYSIDLFSGPGGISTGFKWAGIQPLIAIEISDRTVETYQISHEADVLPLKEYLENPLAFNSLFQFRKDKKTLLIHGDIRQVTNELIMEILNNRFNVDHVDIVTGGAPCESFSMAGTRCEEDERNTLFLNIIRVSRLTDATMFLFENVKGLFSKKSEGETGKMFDDICKEFESEKYDVSYKLASKSKKVVLLNSMDYGVPQARERIILIGINRKYDSDFHYPNKTHGPNRDYEFITVGEALSGLPTLHSGEGEEIMPSAYNNEISHISKGGQRFLSLMKGTIAEFESLPHLSPDLNTITYHKAVNHREKMVKRMELIRNGEGMKKAADRLHAEGKGELVSLYFPNKLYAARNRRLSLDKPSFTVTSHCLDEMIHPIENRGITPREAARLQSFPDWYHIAGPYVKFHSDPEQDKYEQIGDAIPPLLAYAIGAEIRNTLNSINKNQNN